MSDAWYACAMRAVMACLLCAACAQEVTSPQPDASVQPASDAAAPDARAEPSPDAAAQGHDDAAPGLDAFPFDAAPPSADAGPFLPNDPCAPEVLTCLPPGSLGVHQVTDQMTAQAAFMTAQAGQTIQLNGVRLGDGWRIPSFTTLRGCNGGGVSGSIGFAGGGGTAEGLEVTGEIVGNETGAYVVRNNRFGAPPMAGVNNAGVSARTVDGIVSAQVTMIVEGNRFSRRRIGVEARTRYDVGQREVDITIRNNIFEHVASPIVVSESGLVGRITAVVEHNTLFAFDDGITLLSTSRVTKTSGNLLVSGTRAFSSDGVYEAHFALGWALTQPSTGQIIAGSLAMGDPGFVDAEVGDFRLTATSAALDRVPNGVVVPDLDFFGCPRPRATSGGAAMSDIGALEAQP